MSPTMPVLGYRFWVLVMGLCVFVLILRFEFYSSSLLCLFLDFLQIYVF